MITATGQSGLMTAFSNGTHHAAADAPTDKGGQGGGFTPFELLESALACCISMVVRMQARRHGIALASVEVRVTADRSRPGETAFEYAVVLPEQLAAEDRQRLLAAARACPVHQALAQRISFRETA